MIRFLLFILAIVLIGIGAAFYHFKGKTFEIGITESQIDFALQRKFPVSKDYLFVFNMTYSNPELTLLPDDNRIGLSLDAILSLRIGSNPKQLKGHCNLTTGLDFDPDSQAFFLTDALIETLEIDGLPSKYAETASVAASKFALDYVESQPVYRLDRDDPKLAAVSLLVKDVQVKDRKIVISLGL